DPRDGKTYKTVKVGDQWIMAENLAYKPDSGNYWAYDDVDSNIAIYGYLYDFGTAINIAPEGWHLPSYKEWTAIEKLLGAKRNTISYSRELYPKLLLGGDSGLDILLGGIRTCDGEYKRMDEMARFWHSFDKRRKRASFGLRSKQLILKYGVRKNKVYPVFQSSYEQSCMGYSVRLFKDLNFNDN
ncbi:MAG: hypothetical protein KAH25_02785, partial [Bacteroidales bacterium]|nr:hypothetical protein [Bacteroidales bacterium]